MREAEVDFMLRDGVEIIHHYVRHPTDNSS